MEDLFPPVPEKAEEYALRVKNGRAKMAKSTVAICGLARSIGPLAPVTISRIRKLASYFADHCIIIVENDSEDDTLTFLRNWEKEDKNVLVVSEILGAPHYPQIRCLTRAAALAGYRNKYLELLREHPLHPDFTIIMDTDLEGGISFDGVADSFGQSGWDVIGSNGLSVWHGIERRTGLQRSGLLHFDAWAFRNYGQPEALPYLQVNSLLFRRGEPLVPVSSAFGGMAVYRTEALTSARYTGEDCEHVPLHLQIRENGFDRIFLNPSQITLYSPLHEVLKLRGRHPDPRII